MQGNIMAKRMVHRVIHRIALGFPYCITCGGNGAKIGWTSLRLLVLVLDSAKAHCLALRLGRLDLSDDSDERKRSATVLTQKSRQQAGACGAFWGRGSNTRCGR